MIQITPQMRILVAVEPVDFRKGIDGLAALCRQALASDPLAGTLLREGTAPVGRLRSFPGRSFPLLDPPPHLKGELSDGDEVFGPHPVRPVRGSVGGRRGAGRHAAGRDASQASLHQYSSGSSTVVSDLSASVMIQNFTPFLPRLASRFRLPRSDRCLMSGAE